MTKPKKSKAPAEKRTPAPTIDLKSLCSALDAKDRDFYDRLSDELKKKFSGFLTLRYASSVQGDNLLADYYLRSANQHANMNFFDISKEHRKLQWLVMTTVAPYKLTPRYHKWIKAPSPTKSDTKKINALSEIYPIDKLSDLEMRLSIMSDDEFSELMEAHDIVIK